MKLNSSLPHCQLQVCLDPTVKDKTKLLEDDVKYLHNLVLSKYFLKRVYVHPLKVYVHFYVHRKRISPERKYNIFENIIKIFCYQKILIR